MVIQNPYRELVLADNDILVELETIYAQQGKWSEYIGNTNPVVLEIGTGMGNFFSKQVIENPEINYVGMEIRYKRLFQTAEKSRKNNDSSDNFVLLKDFGQNIDKIFGVGEVFESYIFFPDPWGKKQSQKKNRLLQTDFLTHLYTITQDGGKLYFKTDHREYFESVLAIIEKLGLWKIEKIIDNYESDEIFDMGNITEFEAFYRGKNTDINYLELVKTL
ncbi:tRNA (guanosine(46)-N7)-methyltransferase TrmB [Candidatus Gracilibacteria bacterium]|nr:tRNA (guanosine(46)-N7)-methyltransferase TrmB [Candidatus Gracilibacteria bacterium]